MIVLEAIDLVRTYVGGDGGTIPVLQGINLRVEQAEMIAVVGASGAGKSTLLHLLGALDRPTGGEVRVSGQRLVAGGDQARQAVASDAEISALRNRAIGFVFQFHHLLREFSAAENVMMPMWIAGFDRERARTRADRLLERVGLSARATHRPAALSGGEQQRTAVARALAMEPSVLLLDEPSGNLDQANSERLHDLLVELSRELQIAMVVVTHNASLAARANRVLRMEGGLLHPVSTERGS
jgi:lipoprotein-releasing system ATP-binding protein